MGLKLPTATFTSLSIRNIHFTSYMTFNHLFMLNCTRKLTIIYNEWSRYRGLVVIVIAIGPKVRGFTAG